MRLKPRSLVAVAACAFLAACASSRSGEQTSVVGYNSVAEARLAVVKQPGATSLEERGWLIVVDPNHYTLWTFTPPGHEAYPAVVKRVIIQEKDNVFVQMTALCQAEKPACDRLFDRFKRMNEKARRAMQRRSAQELDI
jgi:hypothetical protein